LLNKGVVVYGEVIISVADIDLVYLSLQLVLSSVETARQASRSIREQQRIPDTPRRQEAGA
jgi:hypothetical protein